MKGSVFQRHLVHDAFAVEKAWPKQVALEVSSTPENAEFEPWVQDMSPKPLELPAPKYKAGVYVENVQSVTNGVNGVNSHSNGTNGHAKGINGQGTNGYTNGHTNGHTNGVNGLTNGHANDANDSNGVTGATTGAEWEIGSMLKKRVPLGVH